MTQSLLQLVLPQGNGLHLEELSSLPLKMFSATQTGQPLVQTLVAGSQALGGGSVQGRGRLF